MGQICEKQNVPITESKIKEFKNFSNNHIKNNIPFLERIKKKLVDYTFNGGEPLQFIPPIQYKEPPIIYETGSPNEAIYIREREEREKQIREEEQNKIDLLNVDIKFLRRHYLHWNSTYGQEGADLLLQKNQPNIVNGKRKRNVR